jgi:rubrerythrin
MTYKEQFVVEVKADGQILRVRDGAVYLPFGCEYSILLKNLNSQKAAVNVSIDGEDVLDNKSLVLMPLATHELKGFLKDNVAKNRFRFIQKTKQIQEHRGDKVDDGLLRVEFAFEKPLPDPIIKKVIKEVHEHHHHHHDYWPRFTYYNSNNDWNVGAAQTYSSTSDDPRNTLRCASAKMSNSNERNVTMDSLGVAGSLNAPLADEGITVKGNEIHEQYNYAAIRELGETFVIVIALRGMQKSPGVVQQPITVKSKLICSTCGTASKSSFKFCPNCGTFLE